MVLPSQKAGNYECVNTDNAYVSRVEAARLLELSEHGLDYLIKSDQLPVARPGQRNRRSLLRRDVLRVRRERRAAAERRAAEAVARAERRAVRADPPGEVWLSAREVAALLGCTPVWVRRLAAADRLPHVVRGDTFRFRADLIALVVNARRAQVTRLDDGSTVAA